MKTSKKKSIQGKSAARLSKTLQARGFQSYKNWSKSNPHPDDSTIEAVKTKILTGGELHERDQQAVWIILKEFKDLSRVVRKLTNNSGHEGQIATLKLLDQLRMGIEQLQELREKSETRNRLASITSQGKHLPVMASVGPGSMNRINNELNQLMVGLKFQAGCYTTGRSPQDQFAQVADWILEELIVAKEPIDNITEEEWPKWRTIIRKTYLPKVLDRTQESSHKTSAQPVPTLYDALKELITAQRDKECEGRTRDRIKERILARLWAKLGRGKGVQIP